MLDRLPEDVILHIVAFLEAKEAIALVQTCKSNYTLTILKSYWVLLGQNIAYQRPLPLMNPSEASVEELRRAVLMSIAVSDTFDVDGEWASLDHVRWRMFQTEENDGFEFGRIPYDDAWILVLKDGIYFLQKHPHRLLLCDVSAGTIVSSIPFPGEIYCIKHIHYGERIIVASSYMFDATAYFSVWDTSRPNEPLYEKVIENPAWNLSGHDQFIEALVRIESNTIALYIFDIATRKARRRMLPVEGGYIRLARLAATKEYLLAQFNRREQATLAFYARSDVYSMCESMEDKPLEPTHIEVFPFREGQAEWTRMDVVWDNSIRFTSVETLDGIESRAEVISLSEYRPKVERDNHAILTHATIARLMCDPYQNHVVHSGRFGKILPWKVHVDEADEDDSHYWKIQFGSRPAFGRDSQTPCNGPSQLKVLTWVPPDFVRDHGELYDLDFDDSRARLVLYMSNGTVFVFEFV